MDVESLFSLVDFIMLSQVVAISFLIVGLVVLSGHLIPKDFILNKKWYLIAHPNAISFWRGVIGIFAIYFYATVSDFDYKVLAIYLFVFSAILDKTDGDVARKCNLVTETGKSVDPFFDKITYFAGLIYFMTEGYLDYKIFFLFLFLDFISQFMRFFLKKRNKDLSAVSWGKIKTTFAFTLVGLILIKDLFGLLIPNYIFDIILLLTTFLALMSIYGKLPKN